MRSVFLVLAGVAVGATGTYVGGNAAAQAALPIVQQASSGTSYVTNATQKTALTNWVKNNALPALEAQYGVTNANPCKLEARVSLAFMPSPANPGTCDIAIETNVKLPGDFVPGAVQ